MTDLSALTFALPVRAERYGLSLQTANRFSVFINQIALGEHEHRKILWVSPSTSSPATGPTDLQSSQLIWKIENTD